MTQEWHFQMPTDQIQQRVGDIRSKIKSKDRIKPSVKYLYTNAQNLYLSAQELRFPYEHVLVCLKTHMHARLYFKNPQSLRR